MTYPGVWHECMWHVLEDEGPVRLVLEDQVKWRKPDVVQYFPCCLLGTIPSPCCSPEHALVLAWKVLVRTGRNCAKEQCLVLGSMDDQWHMHSLVFLTYQYKEAWVVHDSLVLASVLTEQSCWLPPGKPGAQETDCLGCLWELRGRNSK